MHKKKKKWGPLLIGILLLGALAAGVVLAVQWRRFPVKSAQNNAESKIILLSSSIATSEVPVVSSEKTALPNEMRAMWISFLEWKSRDLSSEEKFRAEVAGILESCKALGLNTIIVAVRPFGDAMYKSSYFPWSHLLTGAQGENPNFDPLEILVEQAHARNLRIEAWINPYRVRHSTLGPENLSADNQAVLHPDWVREVDGALWYDPAIEQVQELVVNGVVEIAENYAVDGIHFDDYFYPEGIGDDFDEATYQASGTTQPLAVWRRNNINLLVSKVYAAIKRVNPNLPFGISPQGNNENNYNTQYSDVRYWMRTAGYVDYIMPQLYWGFAYRDNSGSDKAAFSNKCSEWAGFERLEKIRLFVGIGAYRIGVGDGGSNNQAEWSSGHNLADQIVHARKVPGITGFALFRYDLLCNEEPLPKQESQALAALLT